MSKSIDQSLVVRQSNDLITSSYYLSVAEMRLVWHLVSLIKPDDENFTEYEFSAAELGKMMGDESLTYAEAEAITMRLWRREIHIEQGSWKGAFRWVINAKRNADSGLIKVALDPTLKPLLLNLREWTQARLELLCSLSSRYAVRIYLWACKVRNQSERTWEISIEELRARLEIPAEEYVRFANLNSRVLREPINEINTHTDLRLTYQILRRGHSPYAVRFTIIEGERTSTGNGELIRAKITKRSKQKARTFKRDKTSQLHLLPEPKEISDEERVATLEQLRRVKQEIYTSKSSAN
jgi:plasmid replication initiation protein